MPEAVGCLCELDRDRGVHRRVVTFEAVLVVVVKAAGHRGGKLGEDHTLVLGDVHHPSRFEILRFRPRAVSLGLQPVDPEIVVARPDRVDRRQHHVLVGATIAGHEVVADSIEIEFARRVENAGMKSISSDWPRAIVVADVADGQFAAIRHDPVVVPDVRERRQERMPLPSISPVSR